MTTPSPLQANAAGWLSDLLVEFGAPADFASPIAAGVVFVGVSVGIYVLGRMTIVPLVSRMLARRNLDAHARKPLRKIVGLLIGFVAVATAFGLAGFGDFLQSLATIAAAATLAIGFAMQDVLKNFVAGIFIFTDRPFRIGDWIEWDDHAGIVEDISLRVSRIRTFDNELLTVPNSQLTTGVIKNPVAKDTLRCKFVFGIGYDDDVEAATDEILAAADAHEEILEEPAPSVRLTELADSYVGLQARIWIADPSRADFVRTRAEFVGDVKERFDAEGIDIPYPQRVVHGGIELSDGSVVDPAE